jgi:hypothetical protein
MTKRIVISTDTLTWAASALALISQANLTDEERGQLATLLRKGMSRSVLSLYLDITQNPPPNGAVRALLATLTG